MARTTQQLNQNEMAAYEKFCAEHDIVCDASEVGVANGNILGGFVIGRWLGLAAFVLTVLRVIATREGRKPSLLHYWMLVKSDTRLPLTFAFILAAMLAYRLLMKFSPL